MRGAFLGILAGAGLALCSTAANATLTISLAGNGLAAGSLTAPMPGTVVRVGAEKGQQVAAGDVLVVLEAMKMEHAVRATADGTVDDVLVTAGQQVQDGAVLVVVS